MEEVCAHPLFRRGILKFFEEELNCAELASKGLVFLTEELLSSQSLHCGKDSRE